MGFGREGVHREKANHSKEIRLAEKAECTWQSSLPWAARSVSRAPLQQGEARWAKQKCAWAFPTITCMSLCGLGHECLGRRKGWGHGEGCAMTSISFSEVWPGSLYGRCHRYMHAYWWMSALLSQVTLCTVHAHPMLGGTSHSHRAISMHPRTSKGWTEVATGIFSIVTTHPAEGQFSCLCKL